MATFTRPSSGSGNGNWAHNASDADVIGQITCGSKPEYLVSITLMLGTGKGKFKYSDGSYSSSFSGTSLEMCLKFGEAVGSQYYSGNQIVTTVVQSNGSSGNMDQCTAYTFTFSNPILMTANTTYNIWFRNYDSDTTILCCKKDGYSCVATEGAVRIYTGSGGDNGWHMAIPYVYTGSGGNNGWHQAIPYVYTGSGGTNGWNIST